MVTPSSKAVSTKKKSVRLKGFPKLCPGSKQSTVGLHDAIKQFILEHGLPARDDPAAIDKQLHDYFCLCIQAGERPRVWGMASVLGLTRRELYHVVKGNRISRFSPPALEVIRWYYQMVEVFVEYVAAQGRAAGYDLFLMVRSYGYHRADVGLPDGQASAQSGTSQDRRRSGRTSVSPKDNRIHADR